MHMTEFKAWFEGFTEDMKGAPTKDQWAKIKKRVKKITPDYTPAPIFIERYARPWRRYWDDWHYTTPWVSTTDNSPSLATTTTVAQGETTSSSYLALKDHATMEDWHNAGRAEWRATQ